MTDVNCLEATGQNSWGRAPLDAIQDVLSISELPRGAIRSAGLHHTPVFVSVALGMAGFVSVTM